MKAWLLIGLLVLAPAAAAVEVPAVGRIEVLFTPWDDAEGAVLRAIDAAQRSLHVQMFLLSSRSIARSLIAAHARGVRVEVLADREMVVNGENSQIEKLAAAGIAVWLETRYAAAHNKILLIDVDSDHPVVITGSYNFTWSAQARNAENLLILRDNPALAQVYFANWRRHHAEAIPFAEAVRP
ncbi:phospholipase D family protein [Sulfuricystis thermophila]|uniref:phospholipase D family nuclease n=1 Tax=Sulfuricystis thermophila TaxID=2496847 RepID=UPI0010358C6B|nr:phospholipase D family protein [Sulfuricystis thermophila]